MHSSRATPTLLALAVLAGLAAGQITSIPAMTNPSTQMDFEMMPLGLTTVMDINTFYGVNIVDITPVMPLAADGTYNTNPQLGRALALEPGSTGNLFIVDPPSGTFGGGNGYRIDLGQPSTQIGLSIGDWNGTKDVTFYSGATMIGMTTVSASGAAVMNYYESTTSFDRVDITGSPNFVLPEIWIESGLGCLVTTPLSPASGDITIPLDIVSPMAPTVTVTVEYSLDGGATWNPCTPGAASPISPNPATGVAPGTTSFDWDSVADMVGLTAQQPGVLVQVQVIDGVSPPATCATAPFDVDNVQPPTCILTGPTGTVSGDVQLDIDAQTPNAPTVDITFEYSLDGGATFSLCTPAATSPLPTNPALSVPIGMSTFLWDSRGDMVGTASLAPGVLVQATVDDLVVTVVGMCSTPPFDVDNTSLCSTLCGDCDLNTLGPDIIDALTCAQISAGLVIPSLPQQGCCDSNNSGTVTITDCLGQAQVAAGLPVVLTCP